MLWLPKWLRDERGPGEGVTRRTFLFVGAAAGASLLLPSAPVEMATFSEIQLLQERGIPHAVFLHQKQANAIEAMQIEQQWAAIRQMGTEVGAQAWPHLVVDGKPVERVFHVAHDPVLSKLEAPKWDVSTEWWKES